jgi:hypothetical protein
MAEMPASNPSVSTSEISSKTIVESNVIEKDAVGVTEKESEVQRKKAAMVETDSGAGGDDPGNEVLANFFQSLLAKKPGSE